MQAGTGHPGDKVTCLGRSSADKRKRRPSGERSCHPSKGSSAAPTPPPLFFHQTPGPGPLTAEARRRCPAAACSCRAGLTPRGPDGLSGPTPVREEKEEEQEAPPPLRGLQGLAATSRSLARAAAARPPPDPSVPGRGAPLPLGAEALGFGLWGGGRPGSALLGAAPCGCGSPRVPACGRRCLRLSSGGSAAPPSPPGPKMAARRARGFPSHSRRAAQSGAREAAAQPMAERAGGGAGKARGGRAPVPAPAPQSLPCAGSAPRGGAGRGGGRGFASGCAAAASGEERGRGREPPRVRRVNEGKN